jgi:hypothetical protein
MVGSHEAKSDEVMRQCRKLHKGELHNLYSSPDIIRHMKSRRMRWECMWYTWEREKSVHGFGGKARRKETTWKTEA